MLIKKDAIHPPPIEAEEFLLNLVKKRILMSILFYEPGGIRTPDPRLRRPLLYPTELLIQRTEKAGDENRTHVFSLEGWRSTIELHPQKMNQEGFEPPTHGLEGRCSIQLSYWSREQKKRVMRIELTCSAWKADVLPLNYTRKDM